ncbi:hypothetical protein KUTeg_000729 [Tegillarca granosa]|uniref:G-protein coupled receptors family 1 profile domain-containing protein n=1 Tax=Tegillarca granosa TaxID=220873 RepID=A0ABQ9G2P6_TEGGR|nr:hypothetical protein KUTeg_000729 [Tegillarca granosa]
MYFNSSIIIEIQTDMTLKLIPVAIVVVIYMMLGIFGNILVIIYYGFKLKPNPCFMFTVAMAICDIIVCCLSMPLEMVDILDFYTFPSVIACKILRFVNFTATVASNLFLLCISVERYKKLCTPFQKQITLTSSKVVIVSIFLVGPIMASPSLVFYGVNNENLTLYDKTGNEGEIISRDCKIQHNYKKYTLIYQMVLFVCFTTIFIAILVLYSRVIKEMITMKRFRENSIANGSSVYHISFPEIITYELSEIGNKSDEKISQMKNDQLNGHRIKKKLSKLNNDAHIRMFTLISLSVTVAFIKS